MQKILRITRNCVIYDHSIYRDRELLYSKPEGSVSDFLMGAYQHFTPDYPKFYKMDNLSKLGWLAAEILLEDILLRENSNATRVGVILCNASSSLDTDIRYFETVKTVPSPALFVYTLPNIVIGEICIRHGLKGENAFFVFNEFDTEFLSTYIHSLFREGAIEKCICGWVELIEEKYKAMLLLVEPEGVESGNYPMFDKSTIDTIYNLQWRN